MMKNTTLNVPVLYVKVIDAIAWLSREYRSRSQIIRVAVSRFLEKELKFKGKLKNNISQFKEELENYVR